MTSATLGWHREIHGVDASRFNVMPIGKPGIQGLAEVEAVAAAALPWGWLALTLCCSCVCEENRKFQCFSGLLVAPLPSPWPSGSIRDPSQCYTTGTDRMAGPRLPRGGWAERMCFKVGSQISKSKTRWVASFSHLWLWTKDTLKIKFINFGLHKLGSSVFSVIII